jgi:Rod binding domain-containing protein
MFKGVKGPSVAGGSQTEKIWQSLMVDEMAKGVAKSGGVGLAEKIYKEMVR